MADEGAGLAGVEVEPEPHGGQQGEQLAHHEVHLQHRRGRRVTGGRDRLIRGVNRWLTTKFTCSTGTGGGRGDAGRCIGLSGGDRRHNAGCGAGHIRADSYQEKVAQG